MPVPIFVDDLDTLPEFLREHYVEHNGPEGGFVLDADDAVDHPDVANLRSAFEKQKQRGESLKRQQAAVLAKIEATKRRVRNQSGPAAEIAELKRQHAEELAKLDPQAFRREKVAELERKTKLLEKLKIDKALNEALDSIKIAPSFRNAVFALLRRDGKFSVRTFAGIEQPVVETPFRTFVPVKSYVVTWSNSEEGRGFIDGRRTRAQATGKFADLVRAIG
jgi:hypothetical protein